MPAATLDALLDHGVVSGDTIRGRYAEAHRTAAELADAGIDLAKIAEELKVVQGQPADIGGYFLPDDAKLAKVMRPSASFNAALQALA